MIICFNESRFFWKIILLAVSAISISVASPAPAQELLQNRSFENPVASNAGNNFYSTVPNWTLANVTPVQSLPFNIVRPDSTYANNPQVTPAGGGIQYLDVASAGGNLQQSVTLPADGIISFSGWFSVRDYQQALGGLIVQVRNSSGTVIASASTSFTASDPVGLWKQASANYIPVSAGTYTFEAIIDNYANFDLASLVYYPPLSVTKVSSAISDPVSGTTNPKMIPGAIASYEISVASPSSYTVSPNTIAVVDVTPARLSLMVNDAGTGTGPIKFIAGSSGLTLVYISLASTTDDIEFSTNGGLTWSYAPIVGADGSDPAITHIRIRPRGAMANGSTFVTTLRYVIH